MHFPHFGHATHHEGILVFQSGIKLTPPVTNRILTTRPQASPENAYHSNILNHDFSHLIITIQED